MTEALAQIVLAAGLSSRMGSPKPLLEFDGTTALDLVVSAAAGGPSSNPCCNSVIVVGHLGAEVRAAHDFPADRVRWVENADPAGPQLHSLQLGLEAISPTASAFYIHPVDYPLATAEDYALLSRALDHDAGDHTVFILSHSRRRGHPILCRASVREKLLALGADQTARDVINNESISYVETSNAGTTRDMDTPEDYRALLEMYRASQG